MSQTQQIPLGIREQVHTVINLLLQNGLQYQSNLSTEDYEFLQPKSKYYRYYTRELYEHGPTSRERAEMKAVKEGKEYIKIEGNIENISVGAMVEIIKNQLADVQLTLIKSNRDYYQPFENEIYEESIEFVQKNQNISNKINEMILKHAHLIKKKAVDAKEKEKEKKDHKNEEIRKEIGTYNDGSMGAYGGKRYEGLGARDEFDAFRREKSQSYYSNLQQKSK